MNLDDFIITCFCLIDELLPTVTKGKRLRERGPMPKLAVSLVITMEVVATGTPAQLELSADGAKVSGPVDPASKPCIKRRLSPARASWLCVSQAVKLDEEQSQQVAQIRAVHGDLDIAYDLTQAFFSMLAEHRDTDLDRWLAQAEHSGIRELKSVACGIRRDYAAMSHYPLDVYSWHWFGVCCHGYVRLCCSSAFPLFRNEFWVISRLYSIDNRT